MTLKNNQTLFPITIHDGEYTLSTVMDNPWYKFLLAEYKKSDDTCYIAKMWHVSMGQRKLSQLKNELRAYTVLNSIISNNKRILDEKFPDLSIPKLINVEHSFDRLILILEKKSGQPASIPDSEKTNTYKSILDYLALISALATVEQKIGFKSKNGWFFVLTFPLCAATAILKHPLLYSEVVYIIARMTKYITPILTSGEFGFVHRDLNPANIITSGGKHSIVDFQLFTVSLLSQDFGSLVYSVWNQENDTFVKQALTDTLKDRFSKPENKYMLLYSALFDLAFGTAKNPASIKQFIKSMMELYV